MVFGYVAARGAHETAGGVSARDAARRTVIACARAPRAGARSLSSAPPPGRPRSRCRRRRGRTRRRPRTRSCPSPCTHPGRSPLDGHGRSYDQLRHRLTRHWHGDRLRDVNFFRDRAIQDDPYAYFDCGARSRVPVWQEPHYGVFMVTGHPEAMADVQRPGDVPRARRGVGDSRRATR